MNYYYDEQIDDCPIHKDQQSDLSFTLELSIPIGFDKPHAHWVGTSPDNRFAFVPDLGMDQVVIYRLNARDFDVLEFDFVKVHQI